MSVTVKPSDATRLKVQALKKKLQGRRFTVDSNLPVSKVGGVVYRISQDLESSLYFQERISELEFVLEFEMVGGKSFKCYFPKYYHRLPIFFISQVHLFNNSGQISATVQDRYVGKPSSHQKIYEENRIPLKHNQHSTGYGYVAISNGSQTHRLNVLLDIKTVELIQGVSAYSAPKNQDLPLCKSIKLDWNDEKTTYQLFRVEPTKPQK